MAHNHIHIDPALLEHRHALDARDRALELSGVVLDLGRDVADDVLGQGDAEQGVPGWSVAQASATGEVVQSTQTKSEAHHWHCKHETLDRTPLRPSA